ncbi:MAG: DUF5652 family protein [Candidatus Saccharibacteria bacterium]
MDCTNTLQIPEWIWPIIIILALWTFFWKGLAMWHAARKKNGIWFVILMVFNTVGILDIYYLLCVEKIKVKKLLK